MNPIDIVMKKFSTWLRDEWDAPENMIQPIIDVARKEMPDLKDGSPLLMEGIYFPHLAAICLAQVIAREIGIPEINRKRQWGKIGRMIKDRSWEKKRKFLTMCLQSDYEDLKDS
ncbi:hypothetical protein [uncultured Veillonella sp.]|uniref:hypothetical protein n=1 Tax=uncultured Veillonella sp. TaxID=159268 RepID=UPI00261074CC|nr:hypothetical protein [uncultured Veillonella sp.]